MVGEEGRDGERTGSLSNWAGERYERKMERMEGEGEEGAEWPLVCVDGRTERTGGRSSCGGEWADGGCSGRNAEVEVEVRNENGSGGSPRMSAADRFMSRMISDTISSCDTRWETAAIVF